MLTYKQIAQAVTSKLTSQFPQIPVLQEDVEEGSGSTATGFTFVRPSFKVMLDSITRDERQYNSHRSLTVRIYFFPTSLYNYALEFLDTLGGLEYAFALNLPVQDRTLTISETRNQQIGDATQTKVLEFDFDLPWYDDASQPPTESPYMMEDINLNFTDE
jgi:hypothetical protein